MEDAGIRRNTNASNSLVLITAVYFFQDILKQIVAVMGIILHALHHFRRTDVHLSFHLSDRNIDI